MEITFLKCFLVAKFISVFIHATHLVPLKLTIAINIIEAILADLSVMKPVCFLNALCGCVVTVLLYMLRDAIEFKAWSGLYALWNMIFIYTKGYSVNVAISNNLPALYYTLVDRSNSLDTIINTWTICRCSSIMTQLITVYSNIKRESII